MSGALLDTHVLYWLVSGEQSLTDEALFVIGENQASSTLLVSPITAWKLAVATRKKQVAGRPNLGDDLPDQWFRDEIFKTAARIVPIRQRISIEAAKVVLHTGHKDPGDCFLIATARVKRVPIITRDAIICGIAADNADYLDVIRC